MIRSEEDELGNTYLISRFDRDFDLARPTGFVDQAAAQLSFNIDRMVDIAEEHGVELLFVDYITAVFVNGVLEQILGEKGLPLVQLDVSKPEPYLSDDQFHPNPRGHQLIADRLFNVLKDERPH